MTTEIGLLLVIFKFPLGSFRLLSFPLVKKNADTKQKCNQSACSQLCIFVRTSRCMAGFMAIFVSGCFFFVFLS